MNVSEVIKEFQGQIAQLEAAPKSGWVVKCGPLWLAFEPGYKNPHATTAFAASVFPTKGEAYRVGKWCQNGGGERGIPQLKSEALAEQIANLTQSIEFLSKSAKALLSNA